MAVSHKDEAILAIDGALGDLDIEDRVGGLLKRQVIAALTYAREQIQQIQEIKRPRKPKPA